MTRASIVALTVILLLGAVGCGSKTPTTTVRIPPRVDLTQLEVIGVVEFDSSSERELGPLATQSFTDEARRDQGLVRIAGLGSSNDALDSVGALSHLDFPTRSPTPCWAWPPWAWPCGS